MYIMIHYQTTFHNDSNSSLVYCRQKKATEMFQQYHISLHSTNKIAINKVVSTHDMMVYRERRAITPVIFNFGSSWR
jgi:hypothetical protein